MADPKPEVDLAAFARVREAYEQAGVPTTVHLDVTYRCDLDCAHCYLDDKQWPELSPTELRSVLHQLRDFGVMILTWSGGEVYLRPDFEAALELAASLGFVNRVKTHAGNLTPERVALLARSRVARLDVSVYSLRPEIHDPFVRRPGGLQRTLAGIGLARAAGVDVRVNVSVLPTTIDEMPEIHAHFSALGCQISFATRMLRDLSASEALDVLQLTEQEEARARVNMLRLEGRAGGPRPPTLADQPASKPCGAGRSSAYVAPDGSVWPCVTWPMALGNLRQQTFAEIWRGSALRQQIVAWTNDDRTSCQSCAASGFCFYCPGEAFKRTGDFRTAPPTFHVEARARVLAHVATGGEPFTAEEWATLPADRRDVASPDRFVFPIHRSQRGGGRRVRSGEDER